MSGRSSARVTAPPVASSIAPQRSGGTPRFFHWETAMGFTLRRSANLAWLPK
jgi:hypothetical protein